jgi:hypothetical protein
MMASRLTPSCHGRWRCTLWVWCGPLVALTSWLCAMAPARAAVGDSALRPPEVAASSPVPRAAAAEKPTRAELKADTAAAKKASAIEKGESSSGSSAKAAKASAEGKAEASKAGKAGSTGTLPGFDGGAIGMAIRKPVQDELWREIVDAPDRAWQGPRPQVFTYVLAGDIGGAAYAGSNQQVIEARVALDALLREIKALPRATGLPPATIAHAHLFCIPTLRTKPGTKTDTTTHMASFNFALSDDYRRRVRLLLSDRPDLAAAFRRVGPFLVAFRLPVGEIAEPSLATSRASPALLIDMTGAAPDSIAVFVNAFKESVREEDVITDQALAPLRARFVSALLRVNQAIPFIAEAQAGVSKMLPMPGLAASQGK